MNSTKKGFVHESFQHKSSMTFQMENRLLCRAWEELNPFKGQPPSQSRDGSSTDGIAMKTVSAR